MPRRGRYTLNDILNDTLPSGSTSDPGKTAEAINERRAKEKMKEETKEKVKPNEKINGNTKGNAKENAKSNGSKSSTKTASTKSTSAPNVIKKGANAELVPDTPMLKTANSALVIDTNFILTNLDIVDELKNLAEKFNHIVVVPWIVIQELDGLKGQKKIEHNEAGLQTLGFLARKATEWIFQSLAARDSRIVGQKINQRLDSTLKGDDSILDCCLFFQQEYLLLTVILSNDRNLCNKSLMHNIKTVTYRKGLSANEIAHVVAREAFDWQEQVNQQQCKIADAQSGGRQDDENDEVLKMYFEEREHDEGVFDEYMPDHRHMNPRHELENGYTAKQTEPPLPGWNQHGLAESKYSVHHIKDSSHSTLPPSTKHKLPFPMETKNPIVLHRIAQLYTDINAILKTDNMDALRGFYIHTVLEEISPIICKFVFLRFPDAAELQHVLGTQNLGHIFVATRKTAAASFAYDENTVCRLRSVDAMIAIIDHLYTAVFEHVLKSFNIQETIEATRIQYMEPPPMKLPETYGTKKIFVRGMETFVNNWAGLWEDLEMTDLARAVGHMAPSEHKQAESMFRDIKEYISGIRRVMNDCIEQIR